MQNCSIVFRNRDRNSGRTSDLSVISTELTSEDLGLDEITQEKMYLTRRGSDTEPYGTAVPLRGRWARRGQESLDRTGGQASRERAVNSVTFNVKSVNKKLQLHLMIGSPG